MNLKTSIATIFSKPLVLAGLIFLLATALYLPSLSYDFVWDDFILIKENPQVRSLANGPRLLVSKAPINQYSQFYRPLFMYSFSWDYAFFQENPWGYHLTNSLIHGLNSSLVTYLALLLLQNPYGALIAGALFALHPAHGEAVAFVAGRVDLLPTLFSLLALLAIAKKTKNSRGWGPLLWAPLFFLLALLSKETAVVVLIPLALLLYQQSPEEEKKLGSVMLKILPSALMLVLYLFLRWVALGTAFTSKLKTGPFYSPFFLFELFLRYWSFLIFPLQRSSYLYESDGSYPLGGGFWLSAGLVLLILAALGYLLYRRRETLVFVALLILPCLPPLFYSLYAGLIMVERYIYLPSVGLALLAAWGFLQIPPRMVKTAGAGMAVILAVYLGATLWRIPLWKNDVVLLEAYKKQYPAYPYVRSSLGKAYAKENRMPEAYREMMLAVELAPNDMYYRHGLGRLYLMLGQPRKAREEFLLVLRTRPDYALALEGMGISYMQEGNREPALKYLEEALRADPQNESILANKTWALSMKATPSPR
jgi:tetratricopeptide (TPR) repeat protein